MLVDNTNTDNVVDDDDAMPAPSPSPPSPALEIAAIATDTVTTATAATEESEQQTQQPPSPSPCSPQASTPEPTYEPPPAFGGQLSPTADCPPTVPVVPVMPAETSGGREDMSPPPPKLASPTKIIATAPVLPSDRFASSRAPAMSAVFRGSRRANRLLVATGAEAPTGDGYFFGAEGSSPTNNTAGDHEMNLESAKDTTNCAPNAAAAAAAAGGVIVDQQQMTVTPTEENKAGVEDGDAAAGAGVSAVVALGSPRGGSSLLHASEFRRTRKPSSYARQSSILRSRNMPFGALLSRLPDPPTPVESVVPVRRAFAREEEDRRAFAEKVAKRDRNVMNGMIGALQQLVALQASPMGLSSPLGGDGVTAAAAASAVQNAAESWITVGQQRVAELDKEIRAFAERARRSVTFAGGDALETWRRPTVGSGGGGGPSSTAAAVPALPAPATDATR